MNQGLTELVFILDKSGSMGGLENDIISGFNAMLKGQQATDEDNFILLLLCRCVRIRYKFKAKGGDRFETILFAVYPFGGT